jgi:hypothetical protein
MPEKVGEIYHVVSMEWILQWRAYVDYKSTIPQDTVDKLIPGEGDGATEKQGKPGTEETHPGEINSKEQLEKLEIVNEPWLRHSGDNQYRDNSHLKTSCKEDEDYVLLNDNTWKYLYELYGGADVPRYSIEAASDD